MKNKTKYNIHCLLYDITKGHFKSKLLCKLNKHNYQLKLSVGVIPETTSFFNPKAKYKTETIIQYHKKITLYYKCYCCGKEMEE